MTDEELLQKNIVRDDFRDKAIERLTNYLESDNKLRKLQPTVLEDVVYDLMEDNWSGVIKRPTGSGKTIIMGEESKAIGEKTLILVHQKNAANQTRDRMIDVVGFDPEKVGVFHSGKSDEEKEQALKASMLIITHSSYSKLIRNETLSYDDYPLVHVDEVHLATGGRRAEMIQNLDEQAYVQGWTATDEVLENGRITTAGKKLFDRDDNIHTTLFSESVEHDEIAPTRNVIFETNISPKIEMRRSGYTAEEEELIISQEGRNEAAVNAFSTFVDEETNIVMRDQKSIWYTWGVENAHNLSDSLNEAFGDGYAEAISGKTPKKEQERLFEAHAKGEIRALVNSDLLIEAHDDPSISVSVMVRPVKSPRIAVQAGGRAARLDGDNDNKIAYVLSLVDRNQPSAAIFGELVGGMDFVSWGGKYTPSKSDTGAGRPEGKPLPTNGVEVAPIYKKVDVIDFFKRRDIMLEKDTLIQKQGDLNSRFHMAEMIGISAQKELATIYDHFQDKYENKTEKQENITVEINGKEITIPSENMGLYQSNNGIVTFGISSKEIGIIKEAVSIPTKPPTHLNAKEMTNAVRMRENTIYELYKKLQSAQEGEQKDQENITVEINGKEITIPSENMGVFRAGSTKVFAIDKKHAPNVRVILEIAPEKLNNLWSAHQFYEKIGNSRKVRSLFNALQSAQEGEQKDQENITVEINGKEITIPSENMGVFGSHATFMIDKKHIQSFRDVLETHKLKTDNLWVVNEIGAELGISRKKIQHVFEKLQSAQEGDQKDQENIAVEINGKELIIPSKEMGLRQSGVQAAFCVDKKHIGKLKKVLGIEPIAPPKTENLFSVGEMRNAIGVRRDRIKHLYDSFHDRQEGDQKGQDNISTTVGDNTLTIPSKDMGVFGKYRAFMIDKKHASAIAKALGKEFKQDDTPEERADSQSTEKWADKVEKKSINPNSEDLKRTGMKRSKDDD